MSFYTLANNTLIIKNKTKQFFKILPPTTTTRPHPITYQCHAKQPLPLVGLTTLLQNKPTTTSHRPLTKMPPNIKVGLNELY